MATASLNDLWKSFLESNGITRPGVSTDSSDIAVDATAGGVTLLAANASRTGATIQNTGLANMRVSLITGVAPTATRGYQLAPGQILSISPPYIAQGQIKAIRESATSTTAYVTETS